MTRDFMDASELLGPIYDELLAEQAASWEAEPDDAPYQDAAGSAHGGGTYTFAGWK